MDGQAHYWQVMQVARGFTTSELRVMLREAQREMGVADQLGDADAGWWQAHGQLLKAALAARLHMDAFYQRQQGESVNAPHRIDPEQVKERVDIVALIERTVPLRRMGRLYKALCPFHEEKTPSFIVFPEQNRFHCFGCDAKGDVIDFVMRTEGLDFGHAMERLAAEVGIKWQLPQPKTPRWAVNP